MNNLFSGARYVLKGFRLITRPGVKRYVVIPLLINTLLFASVIGFGSVRLGALIDRFIPAGWEWLGWIVWPVFLIVVLALVFFGFTALANLVGAPFNGLPATAVGITRKFSKGTNASSITAAPKPSVRARLEARVLRCCLKLRP